MATGRYPRRTSGAYTVNRQASQAIMIRPCLSLRYAAEDHTKEQWMAVVAEEDFANLGRTTSKIGPASRCRHCCASQMTEVDGQSSQRGVHLSHVGVPQRRLGVTGII